MPKTELEWERWLRAIVSRWPAHLYDDLLQTARIGLWKAKCRYDASHGKQAAFTTFAAHYVNGYLLTYMRDYGSVVRVPCHLYEKGERARVVSLDTPPEGGRGSGGAEGDDMAMDWTAFDAAENALLENRRLVSLQVQNALAPLAPKWRAVVWLHAVEGRSFREIGPLLGVTQTRAHQIYKRAAQQLAARLEQEGLR